MDPEALLTVEELTTVVGGPYSIQLLAKQVSTLMGPSGCGKSLLLRAIADLDPHGGRCALVGNYADEMPATAWRSQVAYLPAESGWWEDSVAPHIPEHSQRSAWIEQLGFPDCLEWSVKRCSSGERQRLALIAALCREPRVLLLDEPTAACDPTATAALEALVRTWLNDQRTVLWISHDPAQIERVGQQHLTMDADANLSQRATP